MDLNEIRAELTRLHAQAGQLLSEALHMKPSLKLLLLRKPLSDLEGRLDAQLKEFVALDADLIQHTNPPVDYNTAVRGAAQFSFYVAVRDSVRGLLTDASGALGSLRSRLDILGSVVLSLLALLVAIIALFV